MRSFWHLARIYYRGAGDFAGGFLANLRISAVIAIGGWMINQAVLALDPTRSPTEAIDLR